MRISDWSSDVCSSDLLVDAQRGVISQHMLVWVPSWADDVVRNARTDLYRGVGWLARGVIREAASFCEIGAAKAKDGGAVRRREKEMKGTGGDDKKGRGRGGKGQEKGRKREEKEAGEG